MKGKWREKKMKRSRKVDEDDRGDQLIRIRESWVAIEVEVEED